MQQIKLYNLVQPDPVWFLHWFLILFLQLRCNDMPKLLNESTDTKSRSASSKSKAKEQFQWNDKKIENW